MRYLSKKAFSEHHFKEDKMSSTPNANTGEIPVPRIPPFDEFLKKFDEGYLESCYRPALLMKLTVHANVTKPDGSHPANDFFGAHSKHPKKLELLTPLENKFKEELSRNDVVYLRAHDYVEMVYIIEAIKELAADSTCIFDVSRIMEDTVKEMDGEEDPSWEWITVHTEEEERTDVAAARSGATDPAERC